MAHIVILRHLNVGDSRKFEWTFRDDAAVLSDPDTITVTIRDPTGETTTLDIDDLTHDSAGVFSKLIVFDVAGGDMAPWYINCASTGVPTEALPTKAYVAGMFP